MSSRLIKPRCNDSVVFQMDVIQGVWKFRPHASKKPAVSLEEVGKLGKKLRDTNPGRGEFLSLTIYETGAGEFALAMLYQLGEKDLELKNSSDPEANVLDTYIHFFQKGVGLAYKGYDGFQGNVVAVRSQHHIDIFEMSEARLYMRGVEEAEENDLAPYIMVIKRDCGAELSISVFQLCDGGEYWRVKEVTDFGLLTKSEIERTIAIYRLSKVNFSDLKVWDRLASYDIKSNKHILHKGDELRIPQVTSS